MNSYLLPAEIFDSAFKYLPNNELKRIAYHQKGELSNIALPILLNRLNSEKSILEPACNKPNVDSSRLKRFYEVQIQISKLQSHIEMLDKQ